MNVMKTESPEINFALSSRRSSEKKEDEIPEIAKEYIHKKKDIIPPIGIAHPELVESFMKNMEDEEKILRDVKDLEEYHKENPFQTAKREALSHGARFLEGLLGGVGSFLNALSGEAYFDDKGELLKSAKMLPSSEELHEFTKEKTGKYLEPKEKLAKDTQEAVGTMGEIASFPGSVWSKIMFPVVGQFMKSFVKGETGSESKGELAKMGTMMGLTIANIGNAPQFARRAYNEAINMIPQGTRISASPTIKAFQDLKNQSWFKTGRTVSKGPAMDEITRIENLIQNGTSDAHDLMQARRDINEARKRLGAFNYEPGIDKASARRHLDQVDDAVRSSLESYGKNQNPEWLKSYNRANQAYAVTQRSRQIQDVIQSNPLTKPLQSEAAKTLFHVGGASAILHAPAVLAGAAPIAGIAKGTQILNRMIKSPILRNYYTKVLIEAAANNIPEMHKALEKFDKEAKKMESLRNQKDK